MTEEAINFSKSVVNETTVAALMRNPLLNSTLYKVLNLRFTVAAHANSSLLTDEQRIKFSFTMEQMMLSCIFNTQNCDKNDFEPFYSYFYGRCYKFNPKGVKTVPRV
jgi:hypothetical protein